ncbi:hypothetical protein DH2020_012405 [Rehmannia glutinosa]|uniref:Uncharacterized protein n=1 Tax=Rehmannia glutinosa TaxID=99300 RepID=A0ABR0WZN9_REHGL
MEQKYTEERWANFNSTENSVKTLEDDVDAFSLCDLPIIHQSSKENESDSTPLRSIETPEDFDFCSVSKQFEEMCAADEVFYQGQIMPLRHSSRKGILQYCSRSISSSESMDHFSSSGLISSRSSSSGSGSGGAAAATEPKLPPRNQFHSHPSPSPKIRSPRSTVRSNNRNCPKKSSASWNIFRMGLVSPPPEIAFRDLKNRYPNGRNLRNRNGNGSHSGDGKKIKRRDFLGGCRYCSGDAVDAVSSKVVVMKRSARDGESETRVEEESLLGMMKSPKKRFSHHRTFEWLKQLSLEGAAAEP